MNKLELQNLFITLNDRELNNLKGAKFSYCLHKNRLLLKSEVESLDKANAYSEEFSKLLQEFEPQRIAIAEKYCKKDKDGKPVKKMGKINGQETEMYDMIDQKACNEETEKALKEKNPELYAARLKQVKEYADLLQEEVSTMQLHKITADELPAEITGLQIEQLKEIIRD